MQKISKNLQNMQKEPTESKKEQKCAKNMQRYAKRSMKPKYQTMSDYVV